MPLAPSQLSQQQHDCQLVVSWSSASRQLVDNNCMALLPCVPAEGGGAGAAGGQPHGRSARPGLESAGAPRPGLRLGGHHRQGTGMIHLPPAPMIQTACDKGAPPCWRLHRQTPPSNPKPSLNPIRHSRHPPACATASLWPARLRKCLLGLGFRVYRRGGRESSMTAKAGAAADRLDAAAGACDIAASPQVSGGLTATAGLWA